MNNGLDKEFEISTPEKKSDESELQLGEHLSWVELAERLLQCQPTSYALDQPDTDRARRCGFGEVIFGERKSDETIVSIARQLMEAGQSEVLATRIQPEIVRSIAANFPHCRYDCLGRTLRLSHRSIGEVNARASGSITHSQVIVVTAGSTDLPVAREALETLRWMGVAAGLLTDVGVAGPYRLVPHLARLRSSDALVVCAGMEGALASVLGGLVGCPIIAVPTSVGYGANLAGITTLLSMISSCAAGVSVVNIDAGFKGGYMAGLIATRHQSHSKSPRVPVPLTLVGETAGELS